MAMLVVFFQLLLAVAVVTRGDIIDIRPNYVGVETTTAKSFVKLMQNVVVNLDEIKHTTLNLKLATLYTDCNNTVQLDWYNYERDSSAILGYKVFVREYADKPFKNWPYEQPKYNHYNSKLIGLHQNRFKLKNLLRFNSSYYLVCLVVFSNARPSDEVRLEKKCVNLALPALPTNFDNSFDFCLNSSTTTPAVVAAATTTATAVSNTTSIQILRDLTNKTAAHQSNNKSSFLGLKTKKFPPADLLLTDSSATSLFQCKNYANLLIAFIVCGALLAANIFMFTVIIIQNAMKLKLLRTRIRLNKVNSEFYCLSHNSSSYSLKNNEIHGVDLNPRNGQSKCCCFCCLCVVFKRCWSCFQNVCCDMSEMKHASAAAAVVHEPAKTGLKSSSLRNHLSSSLPQLNEINNSKTADVYSSHTFIPVVEDSYNLKQQSKMEEAFANNNYSHTEVLNNNNNNNQNVDNNDGYILNFPIASYPAFIPSYQNVQHHQQYQHYHNHMTDRNDLSYPIMSFANQQRFLAQATAANPVLEHPPSFDYDFYNANSVIGCSGGSGTIDNSSYLRNFSNFSNEVFFNVPANRFSNIQVSSAF